MSDISKLSDQEKSLIIARMLKNQMLPDKYLPVMSPEFKPIDLYNPANMALAWRVLNWAAKLDRVSLSEYSYPYTFSDAVDLIFEDGLNESPRVWALSPDLAQRLWLDQVLELAIEAGLI